jgi:peptidoglycan/LPS O-acetylase OafA/YrhL
MKMPISQKITLVLWGSIATYFTLVSLAGLFVARNFDTAYGYRKETVESLLVSLAFGVAAVFACFGLQKRKNWGTGMVMALSGASVIYAVSFFTRNSFQSSGSWFVVLLLAASVFSIVASWKKKDNAQPQR